VPAPRHHLPVIPCARLCLILLFGSTAVLPQGLSFGVKGGVPATDALKVTDRARYFSSKAPYVIGPAAELHLFGGLSAEADLFYRRLEYTASPQGAAAATSRTTGQVWEIPLLARYRAPGAVIRPLISAGFSYRRLARLQQRTVTGAPASVQFSDQPPEVAKRSTAGATLGAGLELSAPLVRLSAEVRYTRWGSSSFRSALGGLVSQLNQADFLLGIMF
jgi:opacity protein-like surface antigen